MLTSLRGVFDNGIVHLSEPAPVSTTPIEVVVVFLPSDGQHNLAQETQANLPLEQISLRQGPMDRLRSSWEHARKIAVGMAGSTLSEEVLAERREGN